MDTRDEGGGAAGAIRVRPALAGLSVSPTLRINEEVATLRANGVTVYHMGFGESPFPVHPSIRDALGSSSSQNQYLPSLGLTELRAKAGAYLRDALQLGDADRSVVIGPGSKELIFDVQLAVGGDLLFPAPSWVSYIPQTYITGDRVIRVPAAMNRQYKLTGDALDRAIVEARRRGERPSKLILNYPTNPTGMTYTPDELRALADVARRHAILVISDEIYGMVTFSGRHQSIARYYPEGTIVTTGLSKHLSLGGFRLGVALVPRELDHILGVLRSIASETFSSVATPVQYAVMRAFEGSPEIEEYIAACTAVHETVTKYLWRQIRACGVDYPMPDGAFYLYPDFGHLRERLAVRGITTSGELAARLLAEQSVATLPGEAFGDDPEQLRLRMSTVDYDGANALAVYRRVAAELAARAEPWGPPQTDAFVSEACPNVAEACRRVRAFLAADA